jgi:four helix bundle protein
MQSFKELIIWQKSMELVEEVYRIIRLLPPEEKYALADQIKRSAVSIPSNIAEGKGRNSDREFLRFLNIANGSAYELETQLIICQRLGYIKAEQLLIAFQLCNEIGRMLNAIINKLTAKS